MTLPNEAPLQKLQFYVTTAYTCGYLPKQQAQSLIASPQSLVNAQVYNALIQQGFRRSGKFSYRPHCEHCNACVPSRLLLAEYKPSRSQKRAFKQHQSLHVAIKPLAFDETHFTLYQHYQQLRHSENIDQREGIHSEMEQYRQFLCMSNVESVMVEFKTIHGELKMVSVVDIVSDGVSAVYTFYQASDAKASYGTFNIVWLALWAKNQLKLPYLYLGYWIQDSPKMAYKTKFQPQQQWRDGEWK